MPENNYQLLLNKLDEFIRKYYTNQLIKGLIIFISLLIALFISIVLIEYVGRFNTAVRTGLFYSYSILTGIVFLFLIVKPTVKLFSFGKRISNEQAATIIGKHFNQINDKLFNVLQLKEQQSNNSSDLINASINQKINELSPIPFSLAINLGENRKYLKYLVFPMTLIIVIAVVDSKIITESTNRLVAHTQEFVPMAPYKVTIENKKLQAYKNGDYTILISVEGQELPNSLNIQYADQQFLMNKKSQDSFQYSFKNVQENVEFNFSDGEFTSKSYTLKVQPKPLLVDFSILIDYPAYINKKNQTINNTGDLVIPEGTQVKWLFRTVETDELIFITKDSAINLAQSAENEFTFKDRFYYSQQYGISTSNKYLHFEDTVYYNLNVVKDTRPSIEVDAKDDSLNPKMRYFKGFVKDDYGFSRLVFHAQFIGINDSIGKPFSEEIPINKSLPQTDFYHAWNSNQFQLKAGDRVEYYFEVWDNDGVNGSKSARTSKQEFKAPTKDELVEKNKKTSEEVKKELTENIKLTKEIKKDLEDLKEKLLTKKEMGFQEKKQLESLLEKQKKVQESLKKINQKNEKNNRMQEEFSPEDEALLEKQKQLEELFKNVMSDEMKEMMKEMEKMMEKLNKNELQKSLEKIELSNDELEKELDRNLELFKQLELEKNLSEAKEKLDEIKEDQAKLKEESLEKRSEEEDLKKEQDELNKEFEELSEKLDDIEKKNQELEEPNKMEDTSPMEEEIKKNMKESSEELSKKNKKNASEKQQKSESKMEELSQKLSDMQSKMQSQANAENLEDLRAILENLIELSFDQEAVMEQLKNTNQNDPQYVSLAQEQKKLKDDSKIIEDSLFALSKRVIQLKSIINKEISSVNFNMEKAIDELGERRTSLANSRQQLSMTSINNLALLLDEAIQNIQMQMQMQQGKGNCEKPGGGKPSSGKGGMKKMQQQLNKQMEALKKAMEEGEKPGGKKGSGKPGQGGKAGMSKELAQMAAKQAALRKAIEEMQEEIGESNGNGGGSLKKIGELMEETETDLVNKQITNQTLLRQQEILTRLLQSEKAEREREKEEKREAVEFTDEINRNPKTIFEYNKRKEKEIELLKTLPPSFNSFYKLKVSEYFNQLE